MNSWCVLSFNAIGYAESCRSSMTLAVLLLCTLRYYWDILHTVTNVETNGAVFTTLSKIVNISILRSAWHPSEMQALMLLSENCSTRTIIIEQSVFKCTRAHGSNLQTCTIIKLTRDILWRCVFRLFLNKCILILNTKTCSLTSLYPARDTTKR